MKRLNFLEKITKAFQSHPIVGLLGPRQSGKTTLAQQYAEIIKPLEQIHYFDLEDYEDLAALKTPKAILEKLEGLIIIDEIQRIKELFPLLRVLVDRVNTNQRYLILGSASQDLIKQSSETLAGRIAYIDLVPFKYSEVHDMNKLWIRGGFPRSFLAKDDDSSFYWRENYVRTFLERDIPSLGITIPGENLRRFWQMLCNNHGNILNASDIGKSLSINYKTVRHYLDILVGTFMVRQLSPWFENISKRQVKAPKIYIRDSGMLHNLLQIKNKDELIRNIKLGASWEGFALEEIIKHHDLYVNDCYFWSTQNKAELDLFFIRHGKRFGYEFKFTDSPTVTKSIRIAIEDLKLDKVYIIHPGSKRFHIEEKIELCGLERYLSDTTSVK